MGRGQDLRRIAGVPRSIGEGVVGEGTSLDNFSQRPPRINHASLPARRDGGGEAKGRRSQLTRVVVDSDFRRRERSNCYQFGSHMCRRCAAPT